MGKSPKEQLEIIKKGTLEIITAKDLENKIKKAIKDKKPLRVKLGIDPTSPDIHLGFATVLRKLREFQDLGHTAVLIIGDFTAKIGDPTGKKITRPQLSDEEIKKNMKTYLKQALKILKKDNLEIRYNSEWLKKMNFEKIIKLLSKLTIQQILAREDFENRLKENLPIHLHEIIYPIIQGYDSVMLNADIELGGSDQRFNCLVGRELQTFFNQEKQVVILMPLLLGTDGRKMSKSYGNYVGITESANEMFGKIMSLPDELMEQWFKLCTNLKEKEIKEILNKLHPMQAKKRLAVEIVTLYHSKEKAEKAKEEFEKIFQKKEIPTENVLETIKLVSSLKNKPLIEILKATKIFRSNSELKEYLKNGAIEIDSKKIFLDESFKTSLRDEAILKVGKKRFYKIIFE
ncbi:MAG: tyrosine--tRNA ligase [Candidatus Parcubacteria bacterium]|nr:MAG: tyrosine--tRNA ligase [Candidatus Parcubacteria bacterium]